MRSWSRNAFVLFCILASIAVLAHERHGKIRAPASARATANPLVATHLENGAALFRDNCAACHGADGKGSGVPSIPSGPLPTDLTD
ncbi:MAG TPA: c-type cytochrome, partial [Vicinamibacteria bacterium]